MALFLPSFSLVWGPKTLDWFAGGYSKLVNLSMQALCPFRFGLMLGRMKSRAKQTSSVTAPSTDTPSNVTGERNQPTDLNEPGRTGSINPEPVHTTRVRLPKLRRTVGSLLLECLGLPAAEIGRTVGHSRMTIHRWLTGERRPPPVVRARIAALWPAVPQDSWDEYLPAHTPSAVVKLRSMGIGPVDLVRVAHMRLRWAQQTLAAESIPPWPQRQAIAAVWPAISTADWMYSYVG